MKALVLCAGEGTRMRPLSYSQPKHLIPIANVPVLDRILEKIANVGISEVGVVVSPSTEEGFRSFLRTRSVADVRTETVVQEEPRGLAEAVRCGRDFVGDEPFLLYLGDNLLEESLGGVVSLFSESRCAAVIAAVEVEDPRRFGVAVVRDGRVERLVEKPDDPPSDLAVAGLYVFSARIFDAIEQIQPAMRGELEITDAIQWLVENGEVVRAHHLTGWWKDVGRPEDMLEANALLLRTCEHDVQGEIDDESVIGGPVSVAPGAVIRGTIVEGPAVIAAGAEVVNSRLGPNVAVGKSCTIHDSTIRQSLLQNGATIASIELTSSLVGRSCQIRGSEACVMRATLGDYTCIEMFGSDLRDRVGSCVRRAV